MGARVGIDSGECRHLSVESGRAEPSIVTSNERLLPLDEHANRRAFAGTSQNADGGYDLTIKLLAGKHADLQQRSV